MKKKYFINGQSLYSFCKEHNFNYRMVEWRIREKCMTIEQALLYNQKDYSKEIAMSNLRNKIEGRLHKGYTLDEAKLSDSEFDKLSRIKHNRKCKYNVANLAKQYNINYSKLYGRLQRGWSIKKALEN